jgi:hypothetical protein
LDAKINTCIICLMEENLLKKTYQDINGLRGRKLYNFLAIIFAAFLVIGTAVGYFIPRALTQNEKTALPDGQELSQPTLVTYKGVVTYLGENKYSDEKVEYSLNDIKGNDIVLLKATDAKLSIAQGMYVTISGRMVKTKDGKVDVLQVSEVTLKNDSD